jgi:hypothetical protein
MPNMEFIMINLIQMRSQQKIKHPLNIGYTLIEAYDNTLLHSMFPNPYMNISNSDMAKWTLKRILKKIALI